MIITLSFFTTILNLVIFLIVLGLVICIHELGHLYFAKKAGILCHEFSFGMGPKLWSVKKGETYYSIRAIPFGGFVSMSGEETEEEIVKIGNRVRLDFDEENKVKGIIINENNPRFQDLAAITINEMDLKSDGRLYLNEYEVRRNAFYIFDNKEMQIAPSQRRFSSKTIGQRFMTTFGGPLMNFFLALVVYLIIAFAIGVPNHDSTVIGEVTQGAPAYEVLQSGDRIVSINGVEVNSWSGETNSISSELAKTYDGYEIVVERNGLNITLETINPLLVFYGLGFSADSASEDLIIKTPLYLKTELRSGDEILEFNGETMTNWEDVIAFQMANLEGSSSRDDLYEIKVYRQTISDYNGIVAKVTNQNGQYLIEVIATGEDNRIIYTIGGTEEILVSEGTQITKGQALGSGGEYVFEYVVYGEEVLKAMNTTAFSTRIGIGGTSKFSFFGAIGNSFVLLWGAATSIFGTLVLLFTSNLVGVSDLSGFVGIFSMTSQAASQGIIALLSFIGLLSVNLGILNLLPIPALDGGRILFLGYEGIFKKKPNQKLENWLHTIVFFLLIALMLYVTYNDILRLIGLG